MMVVVLMAILAGTILPLFSDSGHLARVNSAKFQLNSIRAQIELYRAHHDGRFPTASLFELTTYTNVEGKTNPHYTIDYRYGPYVSHIPPNPFNQLSLVVAPSRTPPEMVEPNAGYLFDPVNGKLWVNDTSIPFDEQ